ncbi:DUF2637 domain-containing protein [Streptomyces samsunensis]|uniref:DUF2637 domain-containing protein n=1 Tax=Streptomyces malaysiensis subsp. samsunensis TaxID=459658 RepID=A0A9X2M2I5_STRMQ|nr:DUF2637 domain-containing protein [Streptomyces samsunensis]MCQ8833798.1 DUF2637 domain-containing protein [Streptomyces samsunensis]
MAAGKGEIPQLTQTHRVLIGVVVFGALVIAGIGFAGSYAAVRELAIKKGFGNFSSVFPIGIDAGICVLLALDLLLTWIRIPFPLLRQTAWLLTAATIAFNGAASWGDPLGVAMHAVIPVLFVVAVEAARHAVGRIADITADRHMESVRIARWLLAPVPTFRLWRRMKLWELRSYDEVIRLEQERLVYQTSLRARFGRAWRRKAPVEALMPLRLARYGVPLAETAPAGLAAAGIDELPIEFTFIAERALAPNHTEDPALEAAADPQEEPGQLRTDAGQPETQTSPAEPEPSPETEQTDEDAAEGFAEAYQAWLANFQTEPTTAQFAYWLQVHGITTAAGGVLTDEQLRPLLQVLKQRYGPSSEPAAEQQQTDDELSWNDYFYNSWLSYAQEHGAYPDAAALATYVFERDNTTGPGGGPITGEDLKAFVNVFQQREFDEEDQPAGQETNEPDEDQAEAPLPREEESEAAPAGVGAQPAKDQRGPRVNAPIDTPPPDEEEEPAAAAAELTTVDRYYLAWSEVQTQRGDELRSSTQEAEQLSAFLAQEKGMKGRGGKPVSPSNLRRYLLPFRIYNLWAEQRVRSDTPSLDAIAQECATQGITAQHNKPITTAYIAEQAEDFERRWQSLTHHHAQAQP